MAGDKLDQNQNQNQKQAFLEVVMLAYLTRLLSQRPSLALSLI